MRYKVFLILAMAVVFSATAGETVKHVGKRPAKAQAPKLKAAVAQQDAPSPADQPKEPAPPEEPPKETPALVDAATPPTLTGLMDQVANLRKEVLRLQQTVDMYSSTVVSDLQKENERLRDQLKEAYDARMLNPPLVPTPDGQLVEQVLPKAARQDAPAPEEPAKEAAASNKKEDEKKEPKRDLGAEFKAISEWGRSPEVAKGMTPRTASLKGIIALVKPGATDEDLMALGRSLRKQYGDYDNINIEVFDSEKQAFDFKEGKMAGEHRVLSVSKHKDSGRDSVLLFRGEVVQEVPLTE